MQLLRLRPGAVLDDDGPALRHGTARLPLHDPGPAAMDLLRALPDGGVDPATLATTPDLALLTNRLEAAGWIARTIASDGMPLATREPLAFAEVLTRRGVDRAVPVKLSRFAFLHADDGRLVLESGSARARVVLDDPRLAGLVAALAAPVAPGELDPVPFGLEEDERDAVLTLLLGAGLVLRLDGPDPERDEPALAQWDPVDLLFHAHSRLGRRAGGYGGTYPHRDRFPEPPAVRAETGEALVLPRPDLDAVAAADPPLTHAIERRRSIRVHDDDAPIDVRALGELLFRAARVTRVLHDEEGGSYAARPYPSGGGLYELDVYPVVRLCAGVGPGLYRYDASAHALVALAEPGPAVAGLLEQARVAALMEHPPQVLLVLAARFGRVSWKYEGVAYALTLKHVGVAYQTLYLVATAMGLAPCGLGGGDSDLFARAAGLDYATETSVGEFIVGSRPRV